jgi:NAD(P)-dependent dehydrogenase (short-subunit alcohol dehydrogenase family)
MNGTSTARVWFITGASKGFGLEVARAALVHGDRVIATAHDPRKVQIALAAPPDRLLALPLDVTDEQQAVGAAAQAVEHFGRAPRPQRALAAA